MKESTIRKTPEQFIASLHEEQRAFVEYIVRFIGALSEEVSMKMRYGTLFFDYRKWMLYLNVRESECELCFLDGRDFVGFENVLDFKGRKTVSSIAFYYHEDVDEELLQRLLTMAMSVQEHCVGKKWKK